ncbi:MAG TPA: hypothetical protein VFZ61_27570 [Polyangiales bacterium]
MSVPEPTQVSDRGRPSPVRRIARWGAASLVLLWLLGLIGFLRADGVVRLSMPRREQPGSGDLNLASYRYGPTVRASSYYREPVAQHHPMFLVDERRSPTIVEKWASTSYDEAPWVEIEWREPRNLERVLIRHAGVREEESLTVRRYTLRCLGGGDTALEVRDNREQVATHPLRCAGARGVRLEFVPNEPRELVRVFEVEAWGR